MSISKQAILEIAQLSTDAERLARGSSSERKQADILCQRISTIKLVGLSSLETRSLYADALVEEANIESRGRRNDAEHRRAFDNYLAGRLTPEEMTAVEKRDFLSGTQTITWTQGASGGYSVPFFYNPTVFESMSQVDEVLDPDVTSFEMADTPYLLNTQLSGYDLSTVSGSLVGETVQQTGQATPPVLGSILQNNLVFKASFAASIPSESTFRITPRIGDGSCARDFSNWLCRWSDRPQAQPPIAWTCRSRAATTTTAMSAALSIPRWASAGDR